MDMGNSHGRKMEDSRLKPPNISLPRTMRGIVEIGPHLQCASRGLLGEFGVNVVCSGWLGCRAVRVPGRSPHRTWDFAARGRWADFDLHSGVHRRFRRSIL
jgi:hypothetical protein